jgi:murein DD-endopeptidase MepM/ murein hydrolase activator NlpD
MTVSLLLLGAGCATSSSSVQMTPSAAFAPRQSTPRSAPIPNLWPTSATPRVLNSQFGYRTDPISGQKRLHKGVDIKAPRRAPVLAAADGRVVHAGRLGSYGNVVQLVHGGGVETIYAHLDSDDVRVGSSVRQGEVIGRVGATGRVTAPHLHYEVRLNGRPVDPTPYLPGGSAGNRLARR